MSTPQALLYSILWVVIYYAAIRSSVWSINLPVYPGATLTSRQ